MTGLWLGGLAVMQGTVLRSHNAIARFSVIGRMPNRTSLQLKAFCQFNGDFTCLSNCTKLIISTNENWHIIDVCLASVFLMTTL